GQRGDACSAIALQIAVVGEHARSVGDAVLRQHQLQRRIAAGGVGGPQQRRQLLALRAEALLQVATALLQLCERGLLLRALRLGGGGWRAGGAGSSGWWGGPRGRGPGCSPPGPGPREAAPRWPSIRRRSAAT